MPLPNGSRATSAQESGPLLSASKPSDWDYNKGTLSERSLLRDAYFLLQLERFRLVPGPFQPGHPLFSYWLPPSHPLTSLSSLTPFYPSTSLTKNAGALPPRALRFWRSYSNGSPDVLRRAWKTPALWRHLSDPARILYMLRACQDLAQGGGSAFTLNLSPAVECDARQEALPYDWLHRRVRKHLKTALKRDVEFVMVLEETDIALPFVRHPRLHCHGALAIYPGELEKAEEALCVTGGDWGADGLDDHQVKLTASFDDGWCGYLAKNHWRFRSRSRLEAAGSSFAPTFPGQWFGATKRVRVVAEEICSADRREFIAITQH